MKKRTLVAGTARASVLAALTAGLVAAGGGASADTDGDGGILSGNQGFAPVHMPIDIFGNAVGIFGKAGSRTGGGGSAVRHGGPHGRAHVVSTSGRHGVGSGNQVFTPVDAPITACGNAIAILGSARAGCGRSAGHGSYGRRHDHRGDGGRLSRTSGRHSIGGGNQVFAPVTAPVAVCGNAVGILGHAKAGCGFTAHGSSGGSWGSSGAHTGGAGGILGGNQVLAPINLPVTICGNAIGNARATSCAGGSGSDSPGHPPGHHPGQPPGHHPGQPPGHHPGQPPGHHPGQPPGHHPGYHSGHSGQPGKAAHGGLPPASDVDIAARPAAGEHGSGLLPHTGAPLGLLAAFAGTVLAAGIALTTAGRWRSATVTAVPTSTMREGGGAATNESVRP